MCEPPNKKFKACFSEAWLSDPRFKSWISKVEGDESLCHCRLCNKNFSCSWSHVRRHAEAKFHKIKNNTLLDVPKRGQKFRQEWLELDAFKPWLREAPNDEYSFLCCNCNITITGGLAHIKSHANSKLHKEISEKNNIETGELDVSIENESNLSFDERKKAAEIRYAAFIAEKNISYKTATEILKFFQHIGKDSKVLQNMSMGRTKCANIISNVLCPIETQRVVNTIQNIKFSIFIDETSDITNKKWMTFLVRFVDPSTLRVWSQLIKLININARSSSAEELF